jgi:iron complex transport system substrate-binding protein
LGASVSGALRRGKLGLAAAAAAVVLSLSACATGPAGTSAAESGEAAASDQFPVTIEHAFGETVIEEQPERVATVSWVNADVALALDVVPVGMAADEFGANENKSTPWKDAKLEELGAPIGSENAPAQYSETDGIAFDEIAATTPDVILAAYSGLTQEDYDTLSKIAPVVAYPEVAYGTPWQESTRMIGQALGKSAEAEELVAETEQTIADEAAKYPQIEGKTFIYGNLEPNRGDGINLYTAEDNRPRFLSSIGMELAPVVTEAAKTKTDFFVAWSAERANELESDVFVTWVPDNATKEAITADPLLSQIPAVQNGALVADPDNTLTLSISAASPLSLPWALDKFLPQLGEAASAAQ